MAMLAEPRSRQKWSADPRNTTWANDKTKFGYTMMNKMGWSEGQGLGKNLSGETKHIGVRKKKGQHGIGASTFTDDNWIAHQDDFNALLGALNQGLPCPEAPANDAISRKIASLESTVKKSSRKIHYKKYAQGKDLSRASENDLASIFGQRAKSAPSTPQLSGDEDGNESETDLSEPDQGVQIITATMDMNEYFAIKMEAFKERREARRREERLAKERGEDLGMNITRQKQVTLYLDNDPTSMDQQITTEAEPGPSGESSLEPEKKKKKKKKTKHEKDTEVETVQEQPTETSDQTDSNLPEKPKKKKKKSKTHGEVGDEIADEIQEVTVVADEKPAVLSDSENKELKKKKKNKKNKDPVELETNDTAENTQRDSGIDSPSTTEQATAQTNDSEIKKKKKKKKNKELEKENTEAVVSATVDPTTDNNSEAVEPTNLKKRKKKRKHADIEEQPAAAEVAEPAVKKKKKKRKKCETEEE